MDLANVVSFIKTHEAKSLFIDDLINTGSPHLVTLIGIGNSVTKQSYHEVKHVSISLSNSSLPLLSESSKVIKQELYVTATSNFLPSPLIKFYGKPAGMVLNGNPVILGHCDSCKCGLVPSAGILVI